MYKYSKLFCTSLLLALALFSGKSWGASITASLDRDELQLGEEAVLTIAVTYERGQVQLPNIVDNEHLTISNMGTSRSTTIINGQSTKSVEYRYLLAADAAGVYNLDNISVVVDREVLRANPLRFKVMAADERPQQKVNKSGVSLEASLSSDSAYVGQQVIYKVKFLHRVPLGDAHYDRPELGDFLSEQLGEPKQYETVIGNTRYGVYEIKMAIFPTKPGKFTIEPATIKGSVVVQNQRHNQGGLFDDFFMMGQSTKPFTVKSGPVELEVKALPTEGRPVGFSGLVGQFELNYDLSKNEIKANESTTLTLTVQGYGNVPNLAIPAPADHPDYKIYEDKPTLEKEVRGEGLFGRYVAKWALVPSKAGTYEIPQLRLSYFDPEAGAYKVLQTARRSFAVAAGAAPEELKVTSGVLPVANNVVRQQVALLGEDVMPIAQDMGYYQKKALVARDALWGVPLLLLPPLAWLLFFIKERRSRRSPAQLAKIKAAKAFSQLEADLTAAQAASSYEKLAQALRAYYAAKLQQAGCAITPDEIAVILRASGVSGEQAAAAAALLATVEKALYTGAAASEVPQLAEKIKSTMKEIDHVFSK